MTKIVSRFAPSPTGYLHIGGARTALFSWLLARAAGGEFRLRIEDTDLERSTPEATQAIIDSMRWLGLEHDGEIVYQSARADRHNEVIDQLIESGHAYYCRCSKEDVDAMREKAMKEGRKPKYDGTCRDKGLTSGVVRLKAPQEGATGYKDMVKGFISVENTEMDDMILRRTDGSPTYNLAVVVDDHDMGVNHVLRGDDHVNNTPRQILIYRAMGWDVPEFGHVPMILGPDKKKLSKRHGALSVMEYEKMGYLPEAVTNYLARLGWSHGDQELFTMDEMVKLFSTDNLGNSPSVFDLTKFEWVNGQYMQKGDPDRLAGMLCDFLAREVGEEEAANVSRADFARIAPLLQPRAKSILDMLEQSRPFITDASFLAYDEAAVKKFLTEETRPLLEEIAARIEALETFSEETLEEVHRQFLEDKDIKFKAVAQPIRVAIMGKTQSPGLFETMMVLGKEQTLARIRRAVAL
ncbi:MULTISPECIES: glutamate--tRNA ligase [unclassified Pseudodesulfovibrio]|uniref:glutamate--tRNA ligase n=1 Tax=unclassified Pseudodesulfovibrio TaxID=2661612 RepID=UPI000FEC0C74|nr:MULTISPECIES: glutamate--tRNA ligase [unclassified Pseudodesulfovibrio]MCJ2164922.1 glutamate--tRNA ligase [Pseudodesulfovibrio sp. S3-i]RWU03715.1 glutamate--tRNA ligase [Pseudodesulfovibrio sp. S3]